jgi:predicted permease
MRAPDPADWLAAISFAGRRLRRTPVFTIAAIALLGIGMAIAAATASLLNVALFKDPAREKGLVHIGIHSWVNDLPDELVARILADPPRSLEGLAGFGLTRGSAVADGVSRPAAIEAVSGPYFSLLGAVPIAGRLIQDADDRSASAVAVISRPFWRAAFGERADVVGHTIAVAGHRLTIVGVIDGPVRPGGRGADVWVPSNIVPVDTLFGRLGSRTTLEEATVEVAARYGPFDIDGTRRTPLVRTGLSAPMPPGALLDLVWPASIALIVSLVASVSFGLLLFARMAATQSDMAVRIALGATSRDLTRLLTLEVFWLAGAATVVAVNVGSLLAGFVAGQVIELSGFRSTLDVSPDWRVYLGVGALTMMVALAVVARLGWSVARVEALGSMVATGGMGGATLRTAHTSTRLVIAQSAATTVLLLLAALVTRNMLGGGVVSRGLDTDGAAIAWLDQTGHTTPVSVTRRARVVLESAAEMPDIRHAALISAIPGSPARGSVNIDSLGGRRRTGIHYVTAEAFDAFGLAVTRGRVFTTSEDEDAAPVALVSDTAARRFWPGVDPIGRRIRVNHEPAAALEVVVIGVVPDFAPRRGRDLDDLLAVYLPLAHRRPDSALALIARHDGDAGRLAEQIRTTLQRAVPDTGFLSVSTLEQEFHERWAPPASIPRVLGVLGLIVFVVAMGGLYGLMSYLAAMRRREIGIRKALGATAMTLCRMLARETSPMLLAGIVIGILGGLLVGTLFVRGDFRLLDPVAIVTVAGFLYAAGLVGAIAPYVPTIRALTDSLRD